MKYCIFFPLFANLSVTNIWPRVSTHDPDRLYKSQMIQNVDKEYVTTCYRNPSLVVCMMTRGTNDPFVVEGGPVKGKPKFSVLMTTTTARDPQVPFLTYASLSFYSSLCSQLYHFYQYKANPGLCHCYILLTVP